MTGPVHFYTVSVGGVALYALGLLIVYEYERRRHDD